MKDLFIYLFFVLKQMAKLSKKHDDRCSFFSVCSCVISWTNNLFSFLRLTKKKVFFNLKKMGFMWIVRAGFVGITNNNNSSQCFIKCWRFVFSFIHSFIFFFVGFSGTVFFYQLFARKKKTNKYSENWKKSFIHFFRKNGWMAGWLKRKPNE